MYTFLCNLQCSRHEQFLGKGPEYRALPLLLGVSFSWSHTCPPGLSLYGFVSFEFLCELAQLQQQGRKQFQPKLYLKPAASGTLQEVGSAGGKCPAWEKCPASQVTVGYRFKVTILFSVDMALGCSDCWMLVCCWCCSVSRGYLLCRFHTWFQVSSSHGHP